MIGDIIEAISNQDIHMGFSNAAPPTGLHARRVLWIGAAALFALPLVASLLTQEMAWSFGDFALFGSMLLAVCGSYELAMILSDKRAYRLGFGLTLLGMFLLVFANLAVGIIGSEENPVNLAFFGIPLVGIAGALITRLSARGLATTLYVMAVLQIAAALLFPAQDMVFMLLVTGIFTALWLAAAQAFSVAARVFRDQAAGGWFT
jgi:hypothetical protein